MKNLTKRQRNERRRKQLAEQADKRKQAKELERVAGPIHGRRYQTEGGNRQLELTVSPSEAAAHARNASVRFVGGKPKVSSKLKGKDALEYVGEMLEREKLAQAEADRRKKRIAPAYSKGAYQYITDETDPSDLGRKR